MTIGWRRTVAPTEFVVDVSDVKAQARVTHDTEDALFEVWIRAATDWVEKYTQRALLTQTYVLTASHMPGRIVLPYATPLQSITSVKYYDADGVDQTWSSSNYRALTGDEPGGIEIVTDATWPTVAERSDAVRITYVVGATSPIEVPASLVQAVQLLVAHWSANRESVLVGAMSREIEFAVTALCGHYRLFWTAPC